MKRLAVVIAAALILLSVSSVSVLAEDYSTENTDEYEVSVDYYNDNDSGEYSSDYDNNGYDENNYYTEETSDEQTSEETSSQEEQESSQESSGE